jgi:shikimate dehydrogenase
VTSRISGSTRLAGVIGWPIDHTLSPAMHNAAYEELGLDWVYVPLAVPDEAGVRRVAAAARSLPFVGFNITMPYKQLALDLCDEVAQVARIAGAVNTVHVVDGGLIGYNTDGRGLLEALESEAGFVPEGKAVVVYGAGGAASSAVVALVLGGASSLAIVNRSRERAEELVERVGVLGRVVEISCVQPESAAEAVGGADLLLNATSLGMAVGDPSPVPAEWLRPELVVYDLVYGVETQLLADARAAGSNAHDGLGMLVCQGATAADIWRDTAESRMPRDVMRRAAEEAIAARQTR